MGRYRMTCEYLFGHMWPCFDMCHKEWTRTGLDVYITFLIRRFGTNFKRKKKNSVTETTVTFSGYFRFTTSSFWERGIVNLIGELHVQSNEEHLAGRAFAGFLHHTCPEVTLLRIIGLLEKLELSGSQMFPFVLAVPRSTNVWQALVRDEEQRGVPGGSETWASVGENNCGVYYWRRG